MASDQPTTIDFQAERRRGRDRRLETFVVSSPLRTDFAYLVDLLYRVSDEGAVPA